MTDDETGKAFDASRRSFLTRTGVAGGLLALGAQGAGATGTDDADGGGDLGEPGCSIADVLGTAGRDYDYADANLNEADVEFLHSMIEHHWGALQLASLVPERTGHEELLQVARGILDGQYTQIEKMGQVLLDNDVDYVVDQVAPDTEIPEMPTSGAMASLRTIEGSEFDAAWIAIMGAHHQGGVILANRVLREGNAEPVLDLARTMLRVQKREMHKIYEFYVDWIDPPEPDPAEPTPPETEPNGGDDGDDGDDDEFDWGP